MQSMRRIAFLALILVAAIPALAANRGADGCRPSGKPITLNFETRSPKPVYNNRLDVGAIRNLFAMRGQSLSGPHQRALGATYVQTNLSLSGDTTVVKSGRGY